MDGIVTAGGSSFLEVFVNLFLGSERIIPGVWLPRRTEELGTWYFK